MRCWSLRSPAWRFCLLAALLSTPLSSPVSGQTPPSVGAVAAGQAEADLRQLVTRYYEAYARKDLAALGTLWHPKGPGRSARNVMQVEFELRDAAVRSISLSDLSVDAGGGRARAIVEMDVRELKTGRSRTERRVREMTFLQDEGVWKVWNDASSAMLLARRLLSVPAAERAALLSAEPELVSDDALTGLGLEASRLRLQGGMTATLDAITAREQVARKLNNEHALASSLLDSGLLLQVMGQIAEAGKAFAEARDLFARVGTRTEVANLDANLAAVDYLGGNYAAAATRYQQALAVFEAANERPRMASILHGIGNAHYMQGQFERALEAYDRTLAISEATDSKFGAASVLQAIALVHKELGNYGQAAEAYGRSAGISAESRDVTGEGKALQGLGEIYRLQGEHVLALQSFHRALETWDRAMDPPGRAATMFSIGQVHAAERSFPTAAEWYQKALDVDRAARDSAGIARDTGGLGGARFAMGQIDLALAHYEESLALRQSLEDLPGATWTLVHIGVVHASQQRYDEALQRYMRAKSLAEGLGDRAALAAALALKGSAELLGGAPERALESVARAIELAERIQHHDTVSFARTVEGKAHRQAGRSEQAMQALQQAVEALARVPIGPGAESFFSDRRGPYLALADLLVAEGHPAAALDWLERAKQQGLAVMLGGDGAVVTKGLSVTERDEERSLMRACRTAAVKLRRERGRTAPEPERAAALEQELEKLTVQLEALRNGLYTAHPDLRLHRAQDVPDPVENQLADLQPGEAVLAFAVTDARTHVFLARIPASESRPERRGRTDPAPPATAKAIPVVRAVTVEITAAALAGRVERFRDALRQLAPDADTLSSEMYALLLQPLAADLMGVSRLVVVPDTILWGLPMEALRAGSGRYLVERTEISYAASLAALSAARRAAAGHTASGRVLALGGPIVSKAAEGRLELLRPGQKPVLPAGADREVKAVVMLAGPARGQALIGARATADRLAVGVSPGTIEHVAAPLLLSDASPLHSLLVLSPSAAEDSGLTEVGNALEWESGAALAVFPAAEATAGTTGEALAGLSWSMLVAGTPAVMVSRWPLAARPPARLDPLVAGFYRAQLAGGSAQARRMSPAAALQRAARRLLSSPATRHPGYWCGLMLIGR